MMVVTSTDLDYGVIFGPIVVQPSILNPSCLIGLMTEDSRSDLSDTRLSLNLLGLSRRSPSLDWLVCIPPARHEEEQNMEAYSKDGGVYYRTLRIIRAGEPLFVWYSKDFCQTLQIPAVRGRGDQVKDHLVCTSCGEVFVYEFSLMAHKRFKCEESETSNFKETSIENIKTELESMTSKLQKLLQEMVLDGESMVSKDSATSRIQKRHFTNEENTQSNPRTKMGKFSCKSLMNSFSDVSAFRKVELQNKHPSSNFPAKCLKLSDSPDLNLYVHTVSVQDSRLTSVLPKRFPNRTVHAQLPLSQRGSQEVPHSSSMMSVSDPWKQYFLSERLNAGIPYMKNSNPMVEKILQNTSPVAVSSPVNAMALSQNWCAKCNASFRMTSDLVYHMRSHHKREFDPVKKKRDDKLRCNICQETFRERHHLTRHMTSHV